MIKKLITLGLALLLVFGSLSVMPSASSAPVTPVITVSLDKAAYEQGETITLTGEDNLTTAARNWSVTDASGTQWTRVRQDNDGATFTATANASGSVTVKLVRTWDGATDTETVNYTVNVPQAQKKIIGMSAPAPLWNQRVSEVGPGLKARRIFADLTESGNDKLNLVEDAVEDGLLPIISYKVPSPVSAGNGEYNTWANAAATQLDAFDVPIAVAVWHEPNNDMTGSQYVAMQNQLMPIFKRGELKVGPILNGWLLDNNVPEFDSFTSPTLLNTWDWFGIDTYESGEVNSPGTVKPADRLPKLVNYLASKGKSEMPIGIGEYNGYSAQTVAAAGEAILSTEQVWFACIWNSEGGKGHVLSGARLQAFKNTLADPRAQD